MESHNTDELIGGLDISSSEDITVPDELIDQVIGQEEAREVIQDAASQKRHVMMIGSPGTGKSMLSKALAEMMPEQEFSDIMLFPNQDDDTKPKVREVPAGRAEDIVEAHRQEVENKKSQIKLIAFIAAVGLLAYSLFFASQLLIGLVLVAAVYIIYRLVTGNIDGDVPEILIDNSDRTEAPFEDATGAHSGALLGDVRHDPYQSGSRAVPAHKRVESGKIHESNNGVLFMDEINTLDVKDQQHMMTAIQNGEFHITGQSDNSSGSMIQTENIPTDFILVAAGNMDALENMHPALRDRINGYGYEIHMDDTVEDTPEMRKKFARFVAQEVNNDENIPHFTPDAIAEIVREAQRRAGEKGKLTLQLRDLGGLVRVAGDVATRNGHDLVRHSDVIDAKSKSKGVEQQVVDKQMERKEKYQNTSISDDSLVGHVNGLAVMGETAGIVLPIVATVTPSQGAGSIIATGNLQDIAQEAVENVSAIIKSMSGETLEDKDVHIQFVQTYEGVDGDSASVTVAAAVLSALTGTPIRQDVAMTGSLSVRGEVLPVGGVTHKIEAAAKQGINTVIIPKSNEQDVMIEDKYKDQIEIVTAETLADVIEIAFDEDEHILNEFTQTMDERTNSGLLSIDDLNPNVPALQSDD